MANANDIVYVVWGPTAEWADGSGPLGWFVSREDAEQYIEDEKAFLKDEGFLDMWPYNVVDFWIEEFRVERLVQEGAITAEESRLPIGEVVDILNSYF